MKTRLILAAAAVLALSSAAMAQNPPAAPMPLGRNMAQHGAPQPAQQQPDPNATVTLTFGELVSLMSMARAESNLEAVKAQTAPITAKIQSQLQPPAPPAPAAQPAAPAPQGPPTAATQAQPAAPPSLPAHP